MTPTLHPLLFPVLGGFASLAPPKSLVFPSHLSLLTLQSFLLHHILLNPHFITYPPSEQYQKQFWKWAISNLESIQRATDDDEEIDSRIYDRYLELLDPSGPAPGSSQASTRSQICGRGLALNQGPPAESYITHFWKSSDSGSKSTSRWSEDSQVDMNEYQTLTLLESRTTIESGTTGLRTWLASFVLSQYLIQHPELVTDKHVLELGSGVGFSGIIVASLQQSSKAPSASSSIWLTDVNDEVLTRCRDNVNLPYRASSQPNVHFKNLDWSDSLDEQTLPRLIAFLDEIDADIILGADIVFDRSLIPALVGLLRIALKTGSTQKTRMALLALTIRNPETMNIFLNALQDQMLQVDHIDATESLSTSFLETVEGNNAHERVIIIRITEL